MADCISKLSRPSKAFTCRVNSTCFVQVNRVLLFLKRIKKTLGELTFGWGKTTLSWGEMTFSWCGTTWGETDLG